ncbi:STAS-like domain-containing protein [Vibrio diazotrophicus]|uniref:STAS-like domain-containing protein n=1 Tax=Vibrio diazotrophicus TaxID=685 RepID=UPI0022AFC5FB|nr:STAS-like domain-containing protein [Vibrio diazotrophicus]MCZ4374331.1 STAS-like domain-containing protein [Vibrio diazotrophicus]
MDNCLISLPNEFQTLATRKTGNSARQKLLEHLSHSNKVTLDFGDSTISPSFADELIGILAKDMGFDNFKQQVRMINVSASSQAIIKHVLTQRLYSHVA